MISAREVEYLAVMAGLHERSNSNSLTKKDYRFIHAALVGDRLAASRKLYIYLESWAKYART